MTKLMAALIVAAALFVGWRLYLYWDKVNKEEDIKEQQAAEKAAIREEQLPGLPYQLEKSLQAARKQGPSGLANWLKAYGTQVKDPRKAWIQLDYCLLESREDVTEARRVFAEVKQRTPQTSPVWPRITQLSKSYE